jgi:type I restriction enzyme S subunit
MKSNYKRLGDYIQEVNIRNRDLIDVPLLGVSIKKVLMPSIANTIGTDMSTYKLIQKNQFAYGPVTSRNGDKISIALLEENDAAMVSQAYTVFEVIDENEVVPEYLMMWFRRPEFDRYARFMSHGSAREIFSWTELSDTLLPIPSLEKQQEIVKEYNIIQNRIVLNNQLITKLEETAQAIFNHWFENDFEENNLPENWSLGTLKDLCDYSTERVTVNQLGLESYISTENMLQDKKGIKSANNLPNVVKVTCFKENNILISNIRPYFKKIWLANFNGGCSNDVLCLVPKNSIPSLYLYQILEKDSFFEYVMAGSKGTKMPRGDKNWIMNYSIIIPCDKILTKFNLTIKTIQNKIQLKNAENKKLEELKELLLAKMTKVEN